MLVVENPEALFWSNLVHEPYYFSLKHVWTSLVWLQIQSNLLLVYARYSSKWYKFSQKEKSLGILFHQMKPFSTMNWIFFSFLYLFQVEWVGYVIHRSLFPVKRFSGVPQIPEGYNPATWMLEATTASIEENTGQDFAESYKKSAQFKWFYFVILNYRHNFGYTSLLILLICFSFTLLQLCFREVESFN